MAKAILVGQDSPLTSSMIKELSDKIMALQTIKFYVDIEGEGADAIIVTATCGSTVIKGTTNAKGKCVLKSNVLGTYHITYDIGLVDATQTVAADSYGMYLISATMPPLDPGYLMLYDQGDECVDVTGGWHAIEQGGYAICNLSKNVDHLNMTANSSRSLVITSKTISTIGFTKFGGTVEVNDIGTADGVLNNNIGIRQYSEKESLGSYFYAICDDTPSILGKRLRLCDITEFKEDGVPTMWAYGKGSNINLYNMFFLKPDNWQTWLTRAGLNPSNYANLEAVLSDVSIMSILGNNRAAINFMIRCSGTIMNGVLSNDIAFDAMSTIAKQNMAANPHWSKFAVIYGRKL